MNPKDRTLIAVLVVNYFSAEDTAVLLDSLSVGGRGRGLCVVVVDNSCDDAEWARLAKLNYSKRFADFSLIRSSENRGYAGGNNLAFRHCPSEADWIAVINPDAVVESSIGLSEVMIGADPWAIHVAPVSTGGIATSGRSRLRKWSAQSMPVQEGVGVGPAELVYPDGHFFLVSRAAWLKFGGLNEAFFLYCEEVDFALRSQMPIVNVRNVLISHTGGKTTESSRAAPSVVTAIHASRSRVILYRSQAVLRSYLPVMLLARLCYAVGLALRGSRKSARAVLKGIWLGLRETVA